MRRNIYLDAAGAKLGMSADNGAVTSIQFNEVELALEARQLFTIGLRDGKGDLRILASSDFKASFETEEGKTLRFHFAGHPEFNMLEVLVVVRSDGGFFYFKPEISNVPENLLLEWVDAPQIVIPQEGGRLFWPVAEGVLIEHPERRERSPWTSYRVQGYLGRDKDGSFSEGGFYPGVCQMQFLSWRKDGVSLYFGAHDRSHGPKGVEFAPDGAGRIRLSLQTFCGGSGASYRPDFEYALGVFEGDWMDACAVYRAWMEDDPCLPEKGTLPKLVEESPVVIIYPVRGHGEDRGLMTEGNEYFPYVNAAEVVEKYARLFESRIMALLMHWEGTAPWAPPYVWPPFGGAEALASYAERLHKNGNYLGVYCSGSAWTQRSCIIDYSREKECEALGLRERMIQGPHGEIDAAICNGETAQRFGFDMCLADAWARETLVKELEKIVDANVDYAQFFDQNLGGVFHPCYAKSHGHPAVPGPWQTETMISLLDEMGKRLREKGSEMLIGCEAAAADVHIKNLPFSDLRSIWNWNLGVPVPGYQFVFHERVNNFMGNQCGAMDFVDCAESKESLLYRIAFSFSAGDLLSIVLKDGGMIHWGWGASWDKEGPAQEPVVALVKNLNAFRKQHGEFLQRGRMEKPAISIKCDSLLLKLKDRTERVASISHASWTSPDGRRAETFANFLPRVQRVSLKIPSRFAATIDGKRVSSGETLELEPLSAVCVLLN